MNESELLERLESLTLQSGDFGHENHLRLCWYLQTLHPLPEAATRFITGVRKFAAHLKADRLYHETVTLFYFYEIARRMSAMPDGHSWVEFKASNKDLFVSHHEFISQYYSEEMLATEFARCHYLPSFVANQAA